MTPAQFIAWGEALNRETVQALTEDEARTKWCPLSRAVPFIEDGPIARIADGIAAHNRFENSESAGGTNPLACRCIASACMAWQWGEALGPKIGEDHPPNQEFDDHGYAKYMPKNIYGDRRGYCGAFQR